MLITTKENLPRVMHKSCYKLQLFIMSPHDGGVPQHRSNSWSQGSELCMNPSTDPRETSDHRFAWAHIGQQNAGRQDSGISIQHSTPSQVSIHNGSNIFRTEFPEHLKQVRVEYLHSRESHAFHSSITAAWRGHDFSGRETVLRRSMLQ
jgi:hypothetical protein